MNREIKFRAFYDNRWIYFIVGQNWTPLAQALYSECCYKGIVFYQFTGLKDKNGVEIYEGDILKHSSGGNFINRVIDFKDGSFMLTSDEKGRYFPYGAEVIGNIHQNPELL